MIDIQEIKDIIRHRYPFLLVDRVLELEEGKRAVAIKNVTANEEFFNGHFLNYPVILRCIDRGGISTGKCCCYAYKRRK